MSRQLAEENGYPPPQPARRYVTRREGLALARQFLDEMSERRLEVVLCRAPEPGHAMHCVRVVAGQSPRWYQEFCAQYSAKRILAGGAETPYTERIRDFIRTRGRRYAAR